jgi:hypothetical protein
MIMSSEISNGRNDHRALSYFQLSFEDDMGLLHLTPSEFTPFTAAARESDYTLLEKTHDDLVGPSCWSQPSFFLCRKLNTALPVI